MMVETELLRVVLAEGYMWNGKREYGLGDEWGIG